MTKDDEVSTTSHEAQEASSVPARGAVRFVHRYTREEIRTNPNTLYVFGDNLRGRGFGGQAREARGEPNAVGVITKREASMHPVAFLTDGDMAVVLPLIDAAFKRLRDHIDSGNPVVLPTDGVGTGLAQLPSRAPVIFAHIEACFENLIGYARTAQGFAEQKIVVDSTNQVSGRWFEPKETK